MVDVSMGYDDELDVPEAHAYACEHAADLAFTTGQSRIDQDTALLAPDKMGIHQTERQYRNAYDFTLAFHRCVSQRAIDSGMIQPTQYNDKNALFCGLDTLR
jgi:hypothetical protein